MISDGESTRVEWAGPSVVRMLQTADGAILALNSAGVARVAIDQGATPKLRIAARYSWEVPKTDFENCFIDEANLIWFGGASDQATRVTLPVKFWKE